jgi:hypothetical protein
VISHLQNNHRKKKKKKYIYIYMRCGSRYRIPTLQAWNPKDLNSNPVPQNKKPIQSPVLQKLNKNFYCVLCEICQIWNTDKLEFKKMLIQVVTPTWAGVALRLQICYLFGRAKCELCKTVDRTRSVQKAESFFLFSAGYGTQVSWCWSSAVPESHIPA